MKAVTARREQNVDHGQAGTDQGDLPCGGGPIRSHALEWLQRALGRRRRQPIGGGEKQHVGDYRRVPLETDAIAAALCDARFRRVVDDAEDDVVSLRHALVKALTHIFAEQLPRQEGVRQGLVQAGLILSLVELVKSPVEEIAGLAGPDREIARAHIEQMQRVVAAIGDAATDLRTVLDHH